MFLKNLKRRFEWYSYRSNRKEISGYHQYYAVNRANSKQKEPDTLQKFPPKEGWSKTGVVEIAKTIFHYLYNPALKDKGKELLQAGNLSEVLFWNQVKNKQFKGFDFDRQKVIGNYIVDLL